MDKSRVVQPGPGAELPDSGEKQDTDTVQNNQPVLGAELQPQMGVGVGRSQGQQPTSDL